MKRKTKTTSQVRGVRIPSELWARVLARAAMKRETPSDLIRRAAHKETSGKRSNATARTAA